MSKLLPRKLRYRVIFGSVGILAVLLAVRIFAAVPNSQFELEGNAVVDSAPSDDWSNTVPTKQGSSEALATSFIADGSGNATIFTTGGSKDVNDINQWQWKDQLGGLPDKDNITNAYAAAYFDGTNLTIYFGQDRFAQDGDAQMGFWFFKSRVQAIGGKFVGADGTTPAVHQNGDILVIADLENGGAVVNLQVLKWQNGALVSLANDAGTRCGSPTQDPNACAISNATTQTAPWSYTPKSGPSGTFPIFAFVEGGINLTALLGGQNECFSSFMAETRSSQSTTATLKDFALGEFNTCKLEITKTCPGVIFDNGQLVYSYSVTVTNSGFATVYDLVVTDTTNTGYTNTFNQASLAAGASQVFSATFSTTPGPSTPNPPTNTASVTAKTSPGGSTTVSAGPAVAPCPHVDFDASLTITKDCTARVEVNGGKVVVAVDIVGEVCNVAPPAPAFPSPIGNVTVTDDPAITPINLGTINPGQCVPYNSTYYPSTVAGAGNPHDQSYTDTVHVSGTSTIGNLERQNTATANCPLCP